MAPAAIDPYLLDRQTDGRTNDRFVDLYIDPGPHTMWTVSISSRYILGHFGPIALPGPYGR